MESIKDPAFIIACIALVLVVVTLVYFYYKIESLNVQSRNTSESVSVLSKKPGELLNYIQQIGTVVKDINETKIPQVMSLKSENEALRDRIQYLEEYLEEKMDFEIIDTSRRRRRRSKPARKESKVRIVENSEEESEEEPKVELKKKSKPKPQKKIIETSDSSEDGNDDIENELNSLKKQKPRKSVSAEDFLQ